MAIESEFAGLPEQHQNKTVSDDMKVVEKYIKLGIVVHINGLPFELVEDCLMRGTKGNFDLALL